MDVDAVVGGAAEAVGEVEQRLGDPAGYVGEDQVGVDVVGLAEPAGDLGEQPAGDLRAGRRASCSRSSWESEANDASVTAVTVAERGPGSNSDSSPNI